MSAQYGRRAVVTGASSGIGAATARRLRADGWWVAGLSRRSARDVDLPIAADVAVSFQIEKALAGIQAPDLVVHAAGVIEPIAALVESDPQVWRRNVDVNLVGLYHTLRFALPAMIESGRGLLVHVSSGAASHAIPWWSAYCAAKAGALHLVTAAALELEGTGVAVCAINPGITETPMQETVRAAKFPDRERFVRAHEERAGRTPDEVANAIAMLAGRDSRQLNGRVFDVDQVRSNT